MNQEIKLTAMQLSDILNAHKCPECGSYDVIFYNPNMLDDGKTIQTEFECDRCSTYLIFNFGLGKVWKYGSQPEAL